MHNRMEQGRMKAAVRTGSQAIEVKDVPAPALKPGEIEIKVPACGVCGNDVHMWKADSGRVLQEASHGGFDIAFEAVGASSALAACVDGVRPGGKIVMIGNSIDPEIPFAMNRAVLQEMTLIGSVSCTRKEFEETIDLIAGGMIDPEKYVTEVLPLEGLQHALERQIAPNDPMVKFVVKP